MTLIDMLVKLNDRNKVQYQVLSECMTNVTERGKRNDKVSKITFETKETTPSQIVTSTGKIGLVLWCNRDEFNSLIEAEKNGTNKD